MARIMTRMLFVPLGLAFLATLLTGQQSFPDLILLNGKIFTSDSAHPHVEALAIQGERILAAGTSEKIASLAGPATKRIDLGGHTVIPGINDAHYHLFVGPPSVTLQFKSNDPTWQEVKAALVEALPKVPKGAFIVGEFGPIVLEDAQATRAALDKLAPDNPVKLNCWTQHAAILNSAALKRLGVKEDEPDPEGGRFVRSAGGKLTGLVLEFAKFRLDRRMADLASEEEGLQQTRDFLNAAVRFGITSVQNMSEPVSPDNCVALFAKVPTPIRVRVIRYLLTDKNGRMKQEGRDLPANPSPLVSVSGTKWILDGTPVERSAAMRKPYADQPSTSGNMDFSEKEMEEMLRESLENNDQLLVHIAGDRTTETFLNAMEATGGEAVWSKRRVRIEHGDGVMPDLIARTKKLGVVVVENPTHFTLRGLLMKRYGPERTELVMALRSVLESGVPLAIGSDGPNNPYLNIMLASVYPGKPREAITREQAVTAYTLTAAYAEFAEKEKGSLEPGKLADLAVLSEDIFSVPPQDLPKTESVLTMVGGKIVYNAKVVSVQ